MELAELHEAEGPVTAVFSRHIRPECLAEYEEWMREINALSATRKGYLGVTVLRPSDTVHPEFITILRFASAADLAAWEADPARNALVRRADDMAVEPLQSRRANGMEMWFTQSGAAPARPPAKWKMAVLLTGSIFVLSQIVPWVLAPVTAPLLPPLGSLLVIAANVSLLTWLIMPRLTRQLASWLFA